MAVKVAVLGRQTAYNPDIAILVNNSAMDTDTFAKCPKQPRKINGLGPVTHGLQGFKFY